MGEALVLARAPMPSMRPYAPTSSSQDKMAFSSQVPLHHTDPPILQELLHTSSSPLILPRKSPGTAESCRVEFSREHQQYRSTLGRGVEGDVQTIAHNASHTEDTATGSTHCLEVSEAQPICGGRTPSCATMSVGPAINGSPPVPHVQCR